MTYKVFESGETLTANDVMTYFMNQVVVQVDTEAELADLLADHADVRVAYAQDTDKVYAVVAGNWQELAYEGGDFTFDDLTVNGNLTVNGTTTNINSTDLVVEDKNIIIADVATPTDTTADGAGITIKGSTDKTFNWVDSTDAFTASEHINLASGKNYLKNGTDIKDVSETLTNKTISGSNNTITNISLTSGITGTLPVANGGTGQTTANAGLNALLPSQTSNTGKYLTTNGTDTSWGTVTQYSLPSQAGNSGKFLTTNGTTESWGTVDLTSKVDKTTLTTTGDIFYASSASTPARLGIGTTGQVLTVSSGIPSWATPSGSGIVKITSNAFAEQSSVTFNNAFIDAYKCYMIVITDMFDISGNSQMYLRLRTSGGDYTANYYGGLREGSSGSASFTYTGTNGTGYLFGIGNSSATMYITDPINAGTSRMYGNGFAYGASDRTTIFSSHQAAGGSFTGFTITSNNTTNPRLYGKVAVYGLT